MQPSSEIKFSLCSMTIFCQCILLPDKWSHQPNKDQHSFKPKWGPWDVIFSFGPPFVLQPCRLLGARYDNLAGKSSWTFQISALRWVFEILDRKSLLTCPHQNNMRSKMNPIVSRKREWQVGSTHKEWWHIFPAQGFNHLSTVSNIYTEIHQLWFKSPKQEVFAWRLGIVLHFHL